MNAKLLGASTGRPFAESSSNQQSRAPSSAVSSASATPAKDPIVSPVKENDFVEQFVKIVSDNQKEQYAKAFNDEYNEYFGLTDRLKAMAKHAEKLDRDIDETVEGTPEREMAKKKLVSYHNEYKKTGVPVKKRAQYLQSKLAHIKRLIGEYEIETKLAANNNDGDAKDGSEGASSTV